MFEQLRQALDEQPTVQGITVIDIMGFPDPLGAVLKRMMRSGPHTLSALAAELSLILTETRMLADLMVEKGVLTAARRESDGELIYRVRFAGTQAHKLPANLLRTLEDG